MSHMKRNAHRLEDSRQKKGGVGPPRTLRLEWHLKAAVAVAYMLLRVRV